MRNFNSNILLGIFIIVIIIAIMYFLSQKDTVIHNSGTLRTKNKKSNKMNDDEMSQGESIENIKNFYQYRQEHPDYDNANFRLASPQPMIDNRKISQPSNSLVDELIAQYSVEDRPMDGGIGSFTACDPMAEDQGPFNNYGKKRQLNFRQMEQPYADDEYDPRDFSYKKKKFTKRTPEDVRELFDINKMLPQEVEEDWFDVEPLLTTKKIKGTHLIHPKVHMGVNTVMSSLRNGTHDLRGDIPNPKINVSPWLNSTIEPDTNLKGICNPI